MNKRIFATAVICAAVIAASNIVPVSASPVTETAPVTNAVSLSSEYNRVDIVLMPYNYDGVRFVLTDENNVNNKFYGTVENGRVSITDIPAGEYELSVIFEETAEQYHYKNIVIDDSRYKIRFNKGFDIVDIICKDRNTYTLDELTYYDDWTEFTDYISKNAPDGLVIKKYSAYVNKEKNTIDNSVVIDPDNIYAKIPLATGEYTLLDGNGKILPGMPSSYTFSVVSPGGKNTKGNVKNRFYFSLDGGPLSENGEKGDVNNDKAINVTDVTLIAAHVKGIRGLQDSKQIYRADVNNDGEVNVTDVVKVAAHVKGIRSLN